jgi:hypothetical protein
MSAYKEFTVSPRFRTGLIASRLSSGALLVAWLLCGSAAAQEVMMDPSMEGMPYESVLDESAYLGQTPLRIWHRTRGYGEETGETAFGTHWATPTAGGLAFIDGQMRVGNADTDLSINLGGGLRWRSDDYFTGSPRILGFSFWYDGEDTQLDNYFNQLGVSFERLGEMVDLRFNANFPLEDVKTGDDVTFTGATAFVGNNLGRGTLVDADASLRVIDFEIAPRLFNLNAWFYAGGYQMDGEGVSEFGEKGGVRGYITNDLALDVGVTDDQQFGTNTVVQIIWTPGRTSATLSSWSHNIDDRMREQVYRNSYVAVSQTQIAGATTLTDAVGDEIRIVHVDSTAAPGGDGTFENPLNSISSVNANSQVGDIILVHSGSTFNAQNVTLKDAQRFLGEGNNETHLIVTTELGETEIPETAPGAGALAKPTITNSIGPAAVILAGGNDEVDGLARMEVSNFQITGGMRGVYSPTGVGAVSVNRMMIANTTGDGIELTPLVETLANNTTRVRFTPTIDDVMFTNIGGDDIDINATTAEPATTAISETIAISDITSDDGDGVGIRLTNTKRAATIADFDWDGGTTGQGALRIEDAGTQAAVTMNGTNTITGGVTGVAGQGYAIALVDSAATHTVTGTTITNTGGASILASGGTAGMNFTGFIEQTANNVAILSATDGHDGSLTFTELVAGDGVINATTGSGLQFDNADGVYTFNDNVSLVGTSAAINAINGSDAVITISDGTFTNTTGTALNFAGGESSMIFTGQITQTANNATILNVTGGHSGTLSFNELTDGSEVVVATMGSGLNFNNADGAYNFNDGITLTGTSAGITIDNDSDGTFAFTDADNEITNTTGTAVSILDSAANFTYAGEISTDNASGRPVLIRDNDGGSATFTSRIESTGQGILSENNTGGSVLFSGQVVLNTDAQNAVTIQGNTAGSTQFNNIQITTDEGAGFFATAPNGSTATITVTGSANTITTDEGVALSLNNLAVGGSGIAFQSVNSNSTTNGIFLNDITGGTVTIGSGNTPGTGGTIASTGTAISITDAANVTLNNMILSSVNGQGVDYNVTLSAASRLTMARNNIGNTQLEGVRLNLQDAATLANITLNNNTINNASDDEAVLLTTSGTGIKTVNLAVQNANNISNDSATAPAANFIAGLNTTLNATVLNNTFNNTNAAPGAPFRMQSQTGSSVVRLNLNGNNATATSGDEYFLVETLGNFSVEDLATADANNGGEINFSPNQAAFTDDPGSIPTP